MPNYATQAKLEAKVTVPSWIDAEELLTLASAKIRDVVRANRYVYQRASDGLPLDPGTRTTLEAATLSQARFWLSEGYDPVSRKLVDKETGKELPPPLTNEAQEGLSQGFFVTKESVALELDRVSGVAPLAVEILREGLRRGSVVIW